MDLVVGFSIAKSPWKIGSPIISRVESRDYSHTYLKYKCPSTGIIMVAQASNGFVNEVAYSEFLKHNIIVKEHVRTYSCDEFFTILKFIKQNQGIKYSFLQIIAIAIKKLFKIEMDYDNGAREYICSEFVIRALQTVESDLAVGLTVDYITPSDLATLLKY